MSTSRTLVLLFILYRGYADFDDFLSRQNAFPADALLIVVDNTEHRDIDKEQLDRWRTKYEVDYLIAEPENLGYLGAAAFAIKRRPDLLDSEFIAVCNTDLQFQVDEFVSFLRFPEWSNGEVGVIAPRLVSIDGNTLKQLHYIRKPSRVHYERLATIFSHYWLAVLHRVTGDLAGHFRGRQASGAAMPDTLFAPHGALMVFSKDYLERTAGFSYPEFLFCEEIFIGAQCEQAGLNCIFESRLTYSHKRHGTVSRVPSRKVIGYLRDAHRSAVQWLD